MSDVLAVESGQPSAYDLDLEMSLLLPSSAPPAWGAAVHEAARLLVDQRWDQGSRASVDLCTLSLLLFARTYAGDRVPGDVPAAELVEAFHGPADHEPQIIGEIDRALTETGQGRDRESGRNTPLWSIFNTARDQYKGRMGASLLADDIEPPAPGPSPMRGAAGRLAAFFAGYPDQAREQKVAPVVAPGPLIIESDRIQIATAHSIRPVRRCPHDDRVSGVRVDGPEAILVCDQGHVSAHWELDASRVRMAVARATGVRPSAQGTHRFPELVVASTDLLRHSDPRKVNVFLRERDFPLVGRDDVLQQVGRLIDERG
ncbi:hypothetical protein V1460_30525 [Streptomyces sp. SCSIO 30461]|uniref:hypothetical protein n=1 Tax=Streptomyces sp. SCSIO 30461 TaxID=3118085 RepID=UPI0030D3BDFF